MSGCAAEVKMNLLNLNKYSTAALLLLGAGAFFIDLALLTNRGDFTTSAFVISGMVCLITGIFTLTFSWNEPVDPRLLGILPAQGIMNLCCTTQLLGITGKHISFPPALPEMSGSCSSIRLLPISGVKILQRDHFGKMDPQ